MTTVTHHPVRPSTCRGTCAGTAHHDRLLTVDTDPDVLLELMELAVTWHELDYTAAPVVGPAEWHTFAERHHWVFPERAGWAFALALDVVGRRAAGAPPAGRILDLVRR